MESRVNRRQALGTFGAVSLSALLAACGGEEGGSNGAVTTTGGETPTVEPKSPTSKASAELFDQSASCELTPELTEGPFYFDVDSIRSDLSEDREGVQLRLALRVRDAETCEPIENAIVDVWHCDATGNYSGFESASAGGPGFGSGPTDEETYLRGAQATNRDGIVKFKTIYPGWYPGRTVHIHCKVHLDSTTLLTTQLFTNQEFDERVFASAPYSEDPGRDTYNESDGIYDESLEITLSRERGNPLGVMTFDVRRS